MGTRSLIHIYEKATDEKPLVTIYRQFDGYPETAGEDIKKILGERKLVNGYQDKLTQCNGMGCAAALLIGALKGGSAGGFYVYPAGSKDRGEEYTYSLYPDGDTFRLKIEQGDEKIYDGTLPAFDSAALTESAED